MANIKESAPDSEEQKFKVKCEELRKRISEVEESNVISTLALLRTRMSIRRLRLEYAVLLERLEAQVVRFLEENGVPESEAMNRPHIPLLVDDNLDFKAAKSKPGKGKRGRNGGVLSAAALRKAARDPNLPKRPTNAYLMFCDREKDRVRSELEKENPGKPVTELTRVLTEMWKGLSEEAKIPYLRLYEEDRDRYQREMAVYNKRKQEEGPSPSAKNSGLKIKLAVAHVDSDAAEEPETPTETGDNDENENENEDNYENDENDENDEKEGSAGASSGNDTTLVAPSAQKREAETTDLLASGVGEGEGEGEGEDLGKRRKL